MLKKAADVGPLVHSSTDADVDVEVKQVGENNDKKETNWILKVNQADVPRCLEQLDDLLILCNYTVVMR